jgi:SpoVK/Ycf46/Vps4 family AAA+-type ATPase
MNANTVNAIANYIKAGTAGIYIVSHEEGRVEADLFSLAKKTGYRFHLWSVARGLESVVSESQTTPIGETQDPAALLAAFSKLPEQSIVLARDFHAFLGADSNPMTNRMLKEAIAIGKQTQRVFVIVGCKLSIPAELEKEIVVVEFKLPTREQHAEVLKAIAGSCGYKVAGKDVEALLDAASGLTLSESENAFALSAVETKGFSPAIVQREKAATVKKNGILEIIETQVSLEDIGGLEHLKNELFEKRNLFTKEARDFGIKTPRGMLVVGQPGTGKSLTATATAKTFGLPLIRLDAARLFGSLVGQSEQNWRNAFATVKAISPCILWIDEVDGLFAGSGSESSDGGTTQRVIKSILQDMQFSGDGIFFMFTANDIDKLPSPLIDRLDVWSVDLPTQTEREQIWSIQISKDKRSPLGFDLAAMAKASEGFSGRQIAFQAWETAKTLAFNAGGAVTTAHCLAAVARITPTSKTMATEIEARRTRLAGKARPASAQEVVAPVTAQAVGRRMFNGEE